MAEYKLSASLAGHEDDVRAVAFPSAKAVVSASRDGTVRLWKQLSDNPPIFDATISSHATAFVNTVAYLPPSSQFPDGLVISGGKDTVIEVRQPSKGPEENAEALLIGHSHNICALDVDPAGRFIISGSWDAEARIWPLGKWECESVLRGHEGSVWAVLAIDSETVITACADKLIRVFNTSGKLLRTIRGSADVVRALCRLPKGHPSGADFASAGNDGVIRLWTLSGKQVAELHGHENFIYSIASTPSGEIISSGEDRTLRIWKDSQCIQTITHPAISVWGVAVCGENGDIVSGASDRVVRVFTKNSERFADAETTTLFEDSVKESSIPQQSLPEVNKEKLPGPEFLTQKSGTKEGQVQMIRELNGAVTAHTWSSAQGQWINVGTVVDAVGSSGKKVEYLGKEYDFVFDVDIEDGKPPLKLPYNLSQNPYEAATKFIANNELPVTYLEQVANFITTNTQGATIGQTQESSGPDAWGSDQRYRPGEGESSAPANIPPPPKVLPQKEYLSIIVASVPKMQKKIEEVSKALINDGQKGVSLNPEELEVLQNLRKHLESTGATNTSQSVNGGLDLAIKLSTHWPYKDRLAGLDLLRLLAIAPETATFRSNDGWSIIDVFSQAALESSPPSENHVMMAVRGFANLFDSTEGRQLATDNFDKVHAFINTAIKTSTNRNLLVAATTVYINYAVLFTETDPDFEQVLAVLDTVTSVLKTQFDSEVVYRGLVALGTLLTVGDEIREAGKDVYGVLTAVDGCVKKAADPRVKNVGKEIRELLA
ncbi:putative polyubiquitin binding protein (doa1 ufd3) protein [Botrytis fragariae]|uniref:Putative polyubiquitin binding protein (Doa1 ufd3) protein n=1 Tax=Botrytis fragariae TaxID=1964551 RepID=A0A8H6B544_9HELO|nr:putative polyubiquitin binding protein (doa1 ufd3) protein [Botrytis fragariae]KAF5879394.1 putative polyubiquitin binding protein (doa1 ufd3) protein [Botrytis fragariae]